ncbi:MAG: hypothetical protein HS130_10725 [Deltaproteobacteria bacterium]|nr:hypothetical protein [Deltaproteobacteria bacterium]
MFEAVTPGDEEDKAGMRCTPGDLDRKREVEERPSLSTEAGGAQEKPRGLAEPL